MKRQRGGDPAQLESFGGNSGTCFVFRIQPDGKLFRFLVLFLDGGVQEEKRYKAAMPPKKYFETCLRSSGMMSFTDDLEQYHYMG